jgi:outer membrane protein assembly factor BamB
VYTSNSPLQYGFVPYTTGPKSAHIVVRRQGSIDGIQGGLIDEAVTPYHAIPLDFIGNPYMHGQTGPGRFGNPDIVFQGRGYQIRTKIFNGVPQDVWECWDLRTGQVYWDIPGVTRKPTVITYNRIAEAVPGAVSRADQLIATLTYIGASAVAGIGLVVKYDPMTGLVLQNQTIPLTSGFLYADPHVLSVQTLGSGANTQYRLINWTLNSLTSNFTASIMSNITWPFTTLGTADFESMISVTTLTSTSPSTGTAPNPNIRAASLITGQLLWNVSSGIPFQIYSGGASVADHGLYVVRMDDGHYYAFDLRTGKIAWKSEFSSHPWGSFGSYLSASAYGLLYYGQYDGVAAWNWTNGKLAWLFSPQAIPFETPYTNGAGNLNGSTYSFFGGGIIADGIYYTYSIEHSPSTPLTRGWSHYALNATTGALIWSTSGPLLPGVISDGYMTATNFYDGYQYVFGKGQSATTVSAPQTAITSGTPIIISGTVVDKSPATITSPKYGSGVPVPCVSKSSMGDFMAYLYQQTPIPANVIGVPVSIDAVDPNDNLVHIETVTSDASGTFGYTWTPTMLGQYKITATFEGDDSYGSSWAQTYATVVNSPATLEPPTQTPVPDYTMTIIGAAIAIIIAVAIVGILMLRKR